MRLLFLLKDNKFKIFSFIIFLLIINIFYSKTKISYEFVDYKKNTKIYLDRDYIDSSNIEYFEDKKLLKLNRHNKKNIWILSNKKIEIFRPTCLNNNNDPYKNWKSIKIKLNIKGISCTHTKIYSKKYNFFIIRLKSGGPISADPIFLNQNDNKKKIFILNKKES